MQAGGWSATHPITIYGIFNPKAQEPPLFWGEVWWDAKEAGEKWVHLELLSYSLFPGTYQSIFQGMQLLLFQLYQWGNWGTEQYSGLSVVSAKPGEGPSSFGPQPGARYMLSYKWYKNSWSDILIYED